MIPSAHLLFKRTGVNTDPSMPFPTFVGTSACTDAGPSARLSGWMVERTAFPRQGSERE